ncbi:DNA-binding response regulator [Verrucomicrobiota bacterium]|nr:DNA-binding response regulator [Verrucomicrobiota bacterium]
MKQIRIRKPRLVLVDDHPVVREGIRSYLSSRGVAEIVGEAANGAEAMQQVRALRPDVVLMDINLPDVSGFVVTEKLRHELPDVRVLIITMHESREYAVQIVRSGASGYLLKEAKPAEMVAAIQAVYAGENYFSPAVASLLVKAAVGGKKGSVVKPCLSDRERQVLVWIAEGKTSRDMAAQLGVTVRTVNTYRERLMAKTGIRKAADLTRYAIRERLIPLGRGPHAPWNPVRPLRSAA